MEITVPSRFAGPPNMGHGGYVAGLLAERSIGPTQVTLRKPTPLDVPLEIVEIGEGRLELRNGDEVIAECQPAVLDLEVPDPPSLAQARAAEAGSPSFSNGHGVHPTCFGCGSLREVGDGLRVFAGPVENRDQVAAVWLPGDAFAEPDGTVATRWVLAALDCPGAFACMVKDVRAGLLGRIVFEQYEPVEAAAEHIVTGWHISVDGRKIFAGTALFDGGSRLLAAARATWFGMSFAP